MFTKLQKWGNSQGFRIPKSVLESVHVCVGDNVDVQIEGGKIVIVPMERIRGRYDINDLLSKKIERDGELDSGAPPMGKEVW